MSVYHPYETPEHKKHLVIAFKIGLWFFRIGIAITDEGDEYILMWGLGSRYKKK